MIEDNDEDLKDNYSDDNVSILEEDWKLQPEEEDAIFLAKRQDVEINSER
jgi:hypothetical protein